MPTETTDDARDAGGWLREVAPWGGLGRPERTVRQSASRAAARYQWHLLAIAGVVAMVLGCIGYSEYLNQGVPPADPPTWSDVGYNSLKLFFFNAPDHKQLPVALDIARFLAPAVAGWAALTALWTVFRDRLTMMRIPFWRRHFVICGLGYVGTVFVRNIRRAGARVVVIESDPSNPNIELCRNLGVPVIIGDAQLSRVLEAAGVRHAYKVVALCPYDAVNAEIVSNAKDIARDRRRGVLQCLARINEPDLCELLRIREYQRHDDDKSLDFFNTDEISARLLLHDFPVVTDTGNPHIAIARLDSLGGAVLWQAACDWRDKRGESTAPLVVTVIDADAQGRLRELEGRHPALKTLCEFTQCGSSAGEVRDLQACLAAKPPLNCVYVTANRDEEGLETALKLRQEFDPKVPLVVALSRAHGVARLTRDIADAGRLSNISVFQTLEEVCSVELVRGGSFEAVAQELHCRYRKMKPEAPAWKDLGESFKAANRAQARHIAFKLRLIGAEIVPLRDAGASDFAFTDPEIEELAIVEHDRWNSERLAEGWTLGPRDDARKKTEYLVPFAKLPPEIADYDREFVKAIPEVLARVGLGVVRTKPALGD